MKLICSQDSEKIVIINKDNMKLYTCNDYTDMKILCNEVNQLINELTNENKKLTDKLNRICKLINEE